MTSAHPPPAGQPSVSFLLPGGSPVPVGGVKVVLEYANALAARGWAVRVVMPEVCDPEAIRRSRSSLLRRLGRMVRFQSRRWRRSYLPTGWFHLDPRVQALFVPTPEPRHLPPSDAWVASAWPTAPWVAGCAGARLYLIQHLETWDVGEEKVLATWKLPLTKVVIARWLEEIASRLGERSIYIPNGLDFRAFGLDVAPEQRPPLSVSMLFHHYRWKGSADGLAALAAARQALPELQATLFGVSPRPANLPAWMAYEERPAQERLRAIYNGAAIFLAPSWAEGWPLPPAEAMMSGCAVVGTDIGGHREYMLDGETALLCPPRDPAALAERLVQLLGDPARRLALARAGHQAIQRFRWEPAVDRFEAALREAIAAAAPRRSAAG